MAEKKTDEHAPFLHPKHLRGQGPFKLRLGKNLRAFRATPPKKDYGAQVIFDAVLIDTGEPYSFGVKISGANYIALEKKFGPNLCDWCGQTIAIESRAFSAGSKPYISVYGARVGHSEDSL